MAYTIKNFKTKKAVKQAIVDGEKIQVYQPGGLGTIPENGKVFLEGPHYPSPHTWYAQGIMKDGYLVSVK